MIPFDAVNWRFLTEFATRITGTGTVVTPARAEAHYWGSMGRRSDGLLEIELSLTQPRAEFVYTYLHELGHLVMHGATRPISSGGFDLANVDHVQNPEFREEMRELLLSREREADAFARTAQKSVLAIIGGDLGRLCFVG